MSEQKSSSTAIWVAIIGLIGTVLVAVIANIDKIKDAFQPGPVPVLNSADHKKSPIESEKVAELKPAPQRPNTGAKPEVNAITTPDKTVFKEVVTGVVKGANGNFVDKVLVKCSNCLEDTEVYSKPDGTFRLPFSVHKDGDLNQEIVLLISGESFHVRVLDPQNKTFVIHR